LITIEDARELVLDHHPNHVRLYYSKGAQGQSVVTPKELLQSCLRMRPDRILLAELRGEEAFDYLRNVNSGHPGSITSIHASSCDLAFEQLVLLIKESEAGRGLERSDVLALVRQALDVVIQVGVIRHRRCVQEIRYCHAGALT
jgi:type IV secretion system protein VirB11